MPARTGDTLRIGRLSRWGVVRAGAPGHNQGTDGTHEAFGDVTVIDDIAGKHHIEQV
jgi:hypothetical protein